MIKVEIRLQALSSVSIKVYFKIFLGYFRYFFKRGNKKHRFTKCFPSTLPFRKMKVNGGQIIKFIGRQHSLSFFLFFHPPESSYVDAEKKTLTTEAEEFVEEKM